MVEGLNILLDAAVEPGKPVEIHAVEGCVTIGGITKAGEKFSLQLMIGGVADDRD